MDWIQIIFLALVQGITEFLPISSSAHLVLPAQLSDWPDQGLAFDVGVHFGTLIAVLTYFRRDLTDMATDFFSWPIRRAYTEHVDLVLKLGLASLPVAIAGFLAKDFVEDNLRTVPVIAATTILFALVLLVADQSRGRQETVGWTAAFFIGLAQVLALVPGTSRSGITITAALMLGLTRTAASKFSFLLAIPTIAGAQLLLTLDLTSALGDQVWRDLVAGAMISGLAAFVCIHFFIQLVERTGMLPYVIYRLALGVVLVFLIL